MTNIIKTLRLKVKSESYNWLNKATVEVNQVWNWANEISRDAWTRSDSKRKWFGEFDLNNLSSGGTKEFNYIGAGSIQRICGQYSQKRNQCKKLQLNWRKSGGLKRSLGWLPFKAVDIKLKGNCIRFCKKIFRVFESHKLQNIKWKQGCFAQDSVGDWWLCLPYEEQVTDIPAPKEYIGIDLGLKTIASTSDNDKLETGKWTQKSAFKLANAQRRGHKKQAKRIHRKIARQRKDAIHKFSKKIIDNYQNIFIGNVSSTKLVKTHMAKSVLDASWGIFKTQILYKGQQAGRCVKIIDERNTTRTCSCCGQVTGPSGLRQLDVREWVCEECGASHNRDVNAARNILILGSRQMTSISGNEFRTKGV